MQEKNHSTNSPHLKRERKKKEVELSDFTFLQGHAYKTADKTRRMFEMLTLA